jgi:hypothetical protein
LKPLSQVCFNVYDLRYPSSMASIIIFNPSQLFRKIFCL